LGPEQPFEVFSTDLGDFLAVLENRSITGALWIVEPGRVRIHLRNDEDDLT
jgi:hypothetical protein